MPIEDIGQLAHEWRDLESRSDSHSFFLSWHWIGSWLRCLPESVTPLVLRISSGSQTFGLAIIVQGSSPILKFFKLSQITLNAAGDSKYDTVAIEYNGFLAASGSENVVAQAGLDWLLRGGISSQAVNLRGIDPQLAEFAGASAKAHGWQTAQLSHVSVPYADLSAIRQSGKDYLLHLSRNSRQSLNRNLRYYESIGPLEYRIAREQDEALLWLKELQKAHQIYWRARNEPGAFANPFFNQFHSELIRAAFPDGHIEIAQISAGGNPIGYLYNFFWRGTVYAYQSGFHYTDDKHAKPGYVSHYLAIRNALAQDRNIYDFMAGDRRQKTSLSTNAHRLTWLQLRTRILSVRVESCIKSFIAAIHNR